MKKVLLVSILLTLLLSCAVQAKSKRKNIKPEWLTNPKSLYPEQMYLTAIGEGDSRTDAEQNAAGNIAKIFESVVKTDETIRQRYQELITENDINYNDMTDIQKNVNIKSKQTLYNLQFGESFTDNIGKVHVLAYLNRTLTADIYEEKIMKNAERIKYYSSLSRNAKDRLYAYASINAAGTVALANETLLEQLKIISPGYEDFLELDYDHNEIMRKNSELAKEVKCKITIKNDKEKKISSILEEMLTEMGFVISDNALLFVSGFVKFENTDLKRKDGFKFVRYDFNVKISDRRGDVIVSDSEKGKEGHTTEFEAKERAIRTISKKINKKLRHKLTKYFDEMVTKHSKE